MSPFDTPLAKVFVCLAAVPVVGMPLAALWGLASGEAEAHALTCGPRERILVLLERVYGERLQDGGVTHHGLRIELLTDPDDGGFTLLLTYPNGVSCFAFHGDGWGPLKPEQPKT